MSLEESIKFFQVNQEKFAKEHYGNFVVIFGETVEGFFENELDAYIHAKKTCNGKQFLLRKCIRQEEEVIEVFHSRVAN